MIVDLDFASRSIRGQRDFNEDYCAFSYFNNSGDTLPGCLLVLADGVGGHERGDVASEVAVHAFIEAFHDCSSSHLRERLLAGLSGANAAIRSEARGSLERCGLATTLVAAALQGRFLEWVSVGDSPLFCFVRRTGELIRLNEDHSMGPIIDRQTDEGLSPGEREIPEDDRHILRAALTGQSIDLLDTSDFPHSFEDGDIIVGASDGLLSLSLEEIRKITQRHSDSSALELVESLLDAVEAEKIYYQDNATVATMQVRME